MREQYIERSIVFSHSRLLGPDPESNSNIYRPENIDSFRQFLQNNTDWKGVHFFMADRVSSSLSHLNICRLLNVLEQMRLFCTQTLANTVFSNNK